jgi:hypothetical protein
MILRHGADGKYEIYDIGNNTIPRGRFGWLNLSTRASDGGLWRWQRRR